MSALRKRHEELAGTFYGLVGALPTMQRVAANHLVREWLNLQADLITDVEALNAKVKALEDWRATYKT